MGIMQATAANLPIGTGVVVPLVPWSVSSFAVDGIAISTLTVGTDGSLSWSGNNIQRRGSPAWYNPVTVGVGTGYWVRLVPTTTYGPGLSGSSTGVWIQLSSAPSWQASTVFANDIGAIFNLQFATDSGGSNIVSQMTGAALLAYNYEYVNPGA